MKIFTYKDYIYSIHTYRLHAVMGVAEDTEEYQIETEESKRRKEIQQKHDKLIKNILKNKKEFVKFINQFLKPKKELEENELEKYTNSYINYKYRKKEPDIVYKIKEKPIYYLIEHQSTIDYNMPYRILNYCIDIMQEWIKAKKTGKETQYPIVIPIVLYTGRNKWSVVTNFADTQIKETTYGSNYIHLSYNLIDINKYSEQYLLKKDSIFAYCMLIEKANDTKELSKTIKKISKHITEEERLLEIADIVQDLFLSSLEQEEIKNELEKKVGEKNMLTWAERIEAGDQKRLKQKEIQVKREIGKRMQENGVSIELIEEILQLKIKK